MRYKRFRVYKYKANEQGEIIHCIVARRFDLKEEAMKFFNNCKYADFVDYETGEDIEKRGKSRIYS